MTEKRIRILHLSDLHLGKESTSAWRMRRVLGTAWQDNLEAIRRDGPIDLICFTGDLAQSGIPEQYTEATVFVEELLSLLDVPSDRFFCVPGNHDVDRSIQASHWSKLRRAAGDVNEQVFARWMAGSRAPRCCKDAWRDAVFQRQAAYQSWLETSGFSHFLPVKHSHGRLGYRASIDLGIGAPLNIIGLDSAWLAGDDHDQGKLRLTDEQIARLLTQDGKQLTGWTIALVHHPLSDLADGLSARRLLTEYGVSLLLHGHVHDPELSRWASPAHGLHLSSAGCLYEHDRYPNSLQVLDIALTPPSGLVPTQLWARAWAQRGHWHNDDSLYPGSTAGRLRLKPDAVPKQPFVAGSFVGRPDELEALCRALLPQRGSARATVVCCAIEGMPGVGKTRLAEEFLRRHWLPACGVSDAGDLHVHCIRLVIDPLVAPRSTVELAQDIADRLRSAGPTDTLFERLAHLLRANQQLLLIENVDTSEHAQAVAELVNQLPACPILVTARYRQIGGAHWARVDVPPLPKDAARTLLLAEIDNAVEAIRKQYA
jgi:predicted MPP superfamily phosphohydrolase